MGCRCFDQCPYLLESSWMLVSNFSKLMVRLPNVFLIGSANCWSLFFWTSTFRLSFTFQRRIITALFFKVDRLWIALAFCQNWLNLRNTFFDGVFYLIFHFWVIVNCYGFELLLLNNFEFRSWFVSYVEFEGRGRSAVFHFIKGFYILSIVPLPFH